MFNAACEGDIGLVRYHVEHGVDVNYAHPEFLSTPLVACALAGQEQVALYLLESGADPHLRSEFDGMTPVQAAVQAGLPALQVRLRELGASDPASPTVPPNRRMPSTVPVQPQSFLGAYASRGAFTDCYAVTVPFAATLPQFIEAFYTTRLFKLERWLLAKLLKIGSSDVQARELAQGTRSTFSAWKLENRSSSEILLDAGQTRSWLSVARQGDGTTLFFGSAVVPMRPGGTFGLTFHAMLGFHRLYSKLLLSGAAKKLSTALRN